MTSSPPPPPPPSGEEFIAVPASGLRTWNAPDPGSPAVGLLAAGTPIQVMERRGAWALVREQSGAEWWVDGRQLPSEAATSAAPAMAAGGGASGSMGKWLIVIGVVAVAAVAIFLLTRSGGDGEVGIDDLSAEEQAVANNLSRAISDVDGSELGGGELGGLGGGMGADLGLSQEQSDCIAAGVVQDLGTERLEELGVTADASLSGGGEALSDLTVEEREQAADRILGCVDLEATVTELLEEQGMDPAIGTCLLDAIGEDTIRSALVAGLGGEELNLDDDPELATQIFGAVFQCLPADLDLGELGDLGG